MQMYPLFITRFSGDILLIILVQNASYFSPEVYTALFIAMIHIQIPRITGGYESVL